MRGERTRGAAGTGEPFRVQLPADARARAGMRELLGGWLQAHGVSGATLEEVVLAVHEAAANAAEHAYEGHTPASDRAVVVSCDWSGASLSCTVTDRGRWREPGEPGDRGRGLLLIRSLVDECRLEPSSAGTTISMRWRAPR